MNATIHPMNASTDSSAKSPRQFSAVGRNLLWLVAGAVAVAVLSVSAAFAPQITKRLVLFHAIYGAACGFVLGWLATEIQPTLGRWLLVFAFLLAVAGSLNLGWVSYRQFRHAREELGKDHKDQIAAIDMLEKIPGNDLATKERYARERRKYAPLFSDYLAVRVSGLGEWPSPWPAVFWGGEVLIAGVLAGWVLRRQLPRSTSSY